MPHKGDVGGGMTTAERLLAVAGEIFADRGSEATVRQICQAAGCSIAAINYYFGDKNQLYLRCVQEACEQKQKLFPLPDMHEISEDSAPEQLRQFLRTIAGRVSTGSDMTWQSTLMLREILAPSPGVLELLESRFQPDFAKLNFLVATLLGEQLDSLELRESLVTQVLARSMFLRTGKNLRKMFRIDSKTNEQPQLYADSICDSILFQIDALRMAQQLPPLDWSRSENTPTSENVT